MEWLWWTLSVGLMVVGLIGTMVPFVPGTALIFAGAVMHRLLLGPDQSLSWGWIGLLLGLLVLSQVLDLISGALGAKWFGASRWGAIGCILGAVVGLFFGLPGILIGPLLGALCGEILGGKEILPSLKSTWGTLLGLAGGIAAKLFIGGIMIILFFIGVGSR